MARRENATPLFNLPIELREQIYKEVLASPNQGPQLLQTCKEINTEAHKFLFHRAVNFDSQQHLINWLDQTPQRCLHHVTEISLHIQDVSFGSVLEQGALRRQSSGPPQLQNWGLYQRELDGLREALSKLPKIKVITIRALLGRQSFFYRDFLSKMLALLSSLFPNLLDLRLEGNMHHQSLDFLGSLVHLQSFSFDGFSSSSPTETASILARLHNLTSLSLISQHGMLTPNSHVHSSFTAKPQAFNSDVLRAIDQLASLSISERRPTSESPLFFTSEVLASLHTQQTLRKLSVSLSHSPDSETLRALQHYLERSGIECLELDWPDLDPGLLEEFSLVNKSVRVFWVRTRGKSDAFRIMGSIYKAREQGDIQALKKIVLVRSQSGYSGALVSSLEQRGSELQVVGAMKSNESFETDNTDENAVKSAQKHLTSRGVQVAWCTEDT